MILLCFLSKGIKKEYKEINETIQNISEPINRLKDQIEDNAETKIKVITINI